MEPLLTLGFGNGDRPVRESLAGWRNQIAPAQRRIQARVDHMLCDSTPLLSDPELSPEAERRMGHSGLAADRGIYRKRREKRQINGDHCLARAR